MKNGKIAVPSSSSDGLQASLSAHFGHCELYTVIDVENGEISNVTTLPNIPHQQGGCMAPVNYLHEHGVTCLVAGGMGMRPLMGFQQVGIDVFYGAGLASVGEAVQTLLTKGLPTFSTDFTCGGNHHHH